MFDQRISARTDPFLSPFFRDLELLVTLTEISGKRGQRRRLKNVSCLSSSGKPVYV